MRGSGIYTKKWAYINQFQKTSIAIRTIRIGTYGVVVYWLRKLLELWLNNLSKWKKIEREKLLKKKTTRRNNKD